MEALVLLKSNFFLQGPGCEVSTQQGKQLRAGGDPPRKFKFKEFTYSPVFEMHANAREYQRMHANARARSDDAPIAVGKKLDSPPGRRRKRY
eukprot:1333737-Amorphochlora_amoeboformis.AAC.2